MRVLVGILLAVGLSACTASSSGSTNFAAQIANLTPTVDADAVATSTPVAAVTGQKPVTDLAPVTLSELPNEATTPVAAPASALPLPAPKLPAPSATVGSVADIQPKALLIPPELRTRAEGAEPVTTGSIPAGPTARKANADAGPRSITLTDAVTRAVMTFPEVRVVEARLREAKAGIDVASAALYPTAEARLAVGANFSGSYEGDKFPYNRSANKGDGRIDAGVTLRQLIYDFGATGSDIRRAESLRDAERFRLKDKIDETAYKTAQAFVKVMEQRALLSLVDEIIVSHEHLATVIRAQQTEGHGTVADVQRVNSRLVDVRAIRSDVSLQVKSAEDQFERLTGVRPRGLGTLPDLRRDLPGSSAAAIKQVLDNNPRIAVLQATTESFRHELNSQIASTKPKFTFEVDGDNKNFRTSPSGRSQAEAKAMLAVRYRFLDGGLASATQEQIRARIEGGEYSFLNERQQIEADVRQAYRAIESAGRKQKLVGSGVSSAIQVRKLYLEQFKGGKRTVFELLDSQMSYFTIRRSQIESQFESQRAVFDILRATGSLTKIVARGI